jgi:hypothetical protein
MIIFIGIISFLLYYLLVQKLTLNTRLFIAFLFIISTISFKLLVDITSVPDYNSYYDVIGQDKGNSGAFFIFSEPYYFYTVNFLNLYFSKEFSINLFYFINYIITNIFFIWLSFKTDIPIWNKILLYSLYNYFFSYILLRNAPSYILIGFLFYGISNNKFFKISFLAFLSHLSSLPIILVSFFKNKQIDFKFIIFVLILISSYTFFLNLDILNIYEKINAYSEGSDNMISTFHTLYFIFFIILNIFILRKKKYGFLNYTYLFLGCMYLILQKTNPVLGYRFSIYLILYIFLNPNFRLNSKSEKLLDKISISFIVLSIININEIFK